MKILVLAAFLFDCSFSTSCIEEGRSISLFFERSHTSGEEIKIAWYKGDSIVSICSVTDRCNDLDRNTVESSLEFSKDKNTFTTYIIIKKISRTDGVLWKSKYLGEAKIVHPGVLYSRELTLCDIKTTSPFSRFPQESSSVISNMKQENTDIKTSSPFSRFPQESSSVFSNMKQENTAQTTYRTTRVGNGGVYRPKLMSNRQAALSGVY